MKQFTVIEIGLMILIVLLIVVNILIFKGIIPKYQSEGEKKCLKANGIFYSGGLLSGDNCVIRGKS